MKFSTINGIFLSFFFIVAAIIFITVIENPIKLQHAKIKTDSLIHEIDCLKQSNQYYKNFNKDQEEEISKTNRMNTILFMENDSLIILLNK